MRSCREVSIGPARRPPTVRQGDEGRHLLRVRSHDMRHPEVAGRPGAHVFRAGAEQHRAARRNAANPPANRLDPPFDLAIRRAGQDDGHIITGHCEAEPGGIEGRRPQTGCPGQSASRRACRQVSYAGISGAVRRHRDIPARAHGEPADPPLTRRDLASRAVGLDDMDPPPAAEQRRRCPAKWWPASAPCPRPTRRPPASTTSTVAATPPRGAVRVAAVGDLRQLRQWSRFVLVVADRGTSSAYLFVAPTRWKLSPTVRRRREPPPPRASRRELSRRATLRPRRPGAERARFVRTVGAWLVPRIGGERDHQAVRRSRRRRCPPRSLVRHLRLVPPRGPGRVPHCALYYYGAAGERASRTDRGGAGGDGSVGLRVGRQLEKRMEVMFKGQHPGCGARVERWLQ